MEFLVALVVLSILTPIAAVGLVRYLEGQRLNQARMELAEVLKQVSQRALTESRGYRVDLAVGGGSLSWSSSDGPLGSRTLPHGARIVSVSPAGPIQFAGRGFPLSQYRIELALGNRSRSVVLLPTGKVVLP
nr:hypothetical protein [Meiothermus sp. QL-1]